MAIFRLPKKDFLLDVWSHFDFKPEFNRDSAPEGAWLAPMWVGSHRRRLQAYIMLKAYRTNVARWYLSIKTEGDLERRDERHEYGDCELLVQSIVSGVLGDHITIGAPDDDDAPQVYLDWTRDWVKKEKAIRKLTTVEEHAVGEGDGIVEITWNDITERPSMRSYDPGFYFPVLTDIADDFPRKVHLAWQLDEEDHNGKRLVRRITYELVVAEEAIQYPWNEGPSFWQCLKSDGIWELRDAATVDDFKESNATWAFTDDGVEIHNMPIGVDFIPIVHEPNTPADEEHYGVSSLATVLQILDELSATYTDLSKGASIAGFPPLATDGGALATDKNGDVAVYGPGTVYNGKLTSVDTSAGLRVLMDYAMFLLKLLNTNVRVPEILLGRVDPSSPPSGTAIGLMFTQMKMMVSRMHLVREEKHPLIIKFAARFAMAAGDPKCPATTDWPNITFIPGQFIPTDLPGAVAMIISALNAKLISLETAMSWAMEVGVPIEDIEREIEAIQARDFAGAAQAALALGDDKFAFEHVGKPVPPASQRRQAEPDDNEG